jgi:hypothetical protein
MREIKFRAWDGVEMYHSERKLWRIFNEHADWQAIMQFTGLKDKNGKEIYEGDVVTADMKGITVKALVRYSEEKAMFGLSLIGMAPFYEFRDLEVIGNIYENQELVENKTGTV